MPVRQPRFTKEEASRLGDTIYARDIRSLVEPAHSGDIVAIDIETGAWEMDANESTAADRLHSRLPDAQIWVHRVGVGYVRSIRSIRKSNL